MLCYVDAQRQREVAHYVSSIVLWCAFHDFLNNNEMLRRHLENIYISDLLHNIIELSALNTRVDIVWPRVRTTTWTNSDACILLLVEDLRTFLAIKYHVYIIG